MGDDRKVLKQFLSDEDPGAFGWCSLRARRLGLMAMVEPFLSRWEDGKLVNDLSPDAVIKSVGIA